jgi:hydrogenase-4 component J
MMSEQVVFYQLSHKFVDDQAVIPENARQVIYYSLAIGHHLGVLDCLTKIGAVPLEAFTCWLRRLPEGPARNKWEGVLKWGEIEINQSHIDSLIPTITTLLPDTELSGAYWINELIQCLKNIKQEPALYLMVRRQP